MPEDSDKDNPSDNVQRGDDIGELHARREQMADGRRYVIYYTFGEQAQDPSSGKREAATENV